MMRRNTFLSLGALAVLICLMVTCLLPAACAEYSFDAVLDEIPTARIFAGAYVHDPSIIAVDGGYYIFGSHMTAAYTDDLRQFHSVGDGYHTSNPVYGEFLTSDRERIFAYAGLGDSLIPTDDGQCHVWAPDVIWNEAMGKYCMYVSISSTWNASDIALAVSDDIDGPYRYVSTLVYSGFTADTLSATDVTEYVPEDYALSHYIKKSGEYNITSCPNAIDPCVFEDAGGRLWMVYGSWSGGIFILEIDAATGLPIRPEADGTDECDPYFGRHLAGGGHESVEGPYILYDAEQEYYYLFVSYGSLTADGGYQIRVFRSEQPDRGYVDMNGKALRAGVKHENFGLKLSGNYRLPSLDRACLSTGHNSALIDADGRKFLCYHTRFEGRGEFHEPRVKQYFLNREGWPCVLPYATGGEVLPAEGVTAAAVAGRYFFVNQGRKITSAIAEPEIMVLNQDGTLYCENGGGTWLLREGTCYLHMNLNGTEYSGVFCPMRDEAGADVMAFTAVGGNESVWGVCYGD